MTMAIIINSLLLGLFAVQHAVMARPWFKQRWTRIIPEPMERSTFVLAASLCLLLLYVFWQPMPQTIWHIEAPIARAILIGLSLLGFGIVLYASFLIDHFDLFGLRQVVLHFRGQAYTQKAFMERSFYRFVRHPLMLGFLIAFWFTPTMTYGHLLFAVMTTLYIFVGIQMEERDLVRMHGDKYLGYRKRTSMVMPIPRGQRPAT